MSKRAPKKAEESSPYQASEEVYRALFAQAADGIFIANKQGRYIEVNQRGCQMLGYTREELLGLTMMDLIPDEDRGHDPLKLDKLRTGSPFLKERRLRCKDGRLLPVEISAQMLEDGNFLGMVRDISKRKKAEELLQKQEHEFRTLMENSPDFIGRYDQDARVVYVNPALEKLFGKPLAQLRGKTSIEISPGVKGAEKFDTMIREALAIGSPVEIEIIVDEVPGQNPFYHHLRFVPERDHQEQIVSVLFIGRDITPLKENERQLRTLTEHSPDVIARFDREGRYLYVNKTAEKFTGIPAQDLLGQPLGQVLLERVSPVYAEELLSLRHAIEQVFITGTASETEIKLSLPNSEYIFNVRLIPEHNQAGEAASVLYIARDITEARRVGKELQRSNDLLQAIIEAAPVAIIGLDLDGNVQMVWNPAAEKMLGWNAQEVMGRPLPSVPVERQEEFSRFREWVRSGKTLDGVEVQRQRRDGTPLDYTIYASPLHDAEGQIIGNIAVLVDISRRKEMEDELRHTAGELQHVMTSVSDCLWSGETDEEGNWAYNYYSPVVETITGRPSEFYMDSPQRWLNTVHPDDQPRLLEAYQRVLNGQSEREEEEYQIIRPDGTIRWVRDCATATRLGATRLRIDGVVSDITERKQTEEALQKSHEELRVFFSQTINGCFFMMLDEPVRWDETTNQEGVLDYVFAHQHITQVNDAMLAQYGATREQMLKLTPNDFFQHNLAHGRELWRRLFDAGKVRLESNERKLDGTQMWIEGDYILLYDAEGRITGHFGIQRDISERRRAEEQLRESNERFRLLAESSLTGIYLIQDGLFRYVNPAMGHIFGYGVAELTDKLGPMDLVHPDDRLLVAQNIRRRIEGEVEAIHYDFRGVRKDGLMIYVEVHGRRIEYGGKTGVIGTLVDVTERKRSEAELQRNREATLAFSEQLTTLQEVTNQLSKAKSSDDLCRQAVQLGRSRLGFSRVSIWFIDERLGILQGSFGTDEHGELRDERDAQVEFRQEGLTWRVFSHKESMALAEYGPLYNHRGQEVGEGDNAVAALWDGDEVIGVVCVDNHLTQQPITDHQLEVLRLYATTLGHLIRRKRVEESLQQHQAQLQYVVNTVPAGVLLLDANGRIYLMNPVAEQYLAVLVPDWANGRLTHLGQRPLNELFTSPEESLWHEITVKDLIFEAIACPVENSPKNGGWVLIVRDITQERDIQQRVQRQERLAAVGQLAAGIAHDFNNILAVIKLYAQLISRTVEMPTRAQERLHTIEQQTKRATDLIQQILDFSRQSVVERQPLDLLPFMEELVILLDRTLPEHIQVKLDHAAEAYFIQADPSRIQQVMMNLAVNARDAMPAGGHLQIRLSHVQTEAPRPMPVQDLPPGSWVQIEITDRGDGIPQEVLSHIFEPFFTTKEVGEGTGLGLAQVYGIVQQHEGYIDVTTKEGQGTTFTLYFPGLHTGGKVPGTHNKALLQMGQGQRVLVVEDDEATREALLDSLAQLNYEVLAATNGREALTILATKGAEIDLVVSDVVMPEMGGIALFHALQEQNLTIPLVLLTGHPLSKEMENLQTMGLAGWLPKPPDLVNLSNLLAEVLTAPLH